jgi:hypothetical protein
LADSDSDMSMEDVEQNKKAKNSQKSKKKEPQTYIHENEDTIVDLADVDAFSRITSE